MNETQSEQSAQNMTEELKQSKFGIGARLIAAFSVVSFLTVIVSTMSWVSINNLTSAQNDLIEDNVPAITHALNLSNTVTALAAAAPQLNATNTAEEKAASVSEISKTVESAEAILQELNG